MSSKSLPAAEIIDDDEDSLAQAYYCAICSHCYVDKPEFVLHLSSSQHHTRNSQLLAALQFGEAYCSLCVVKIEGVFGVHCSTNEDHLQYYKSIERCFLIAPEAALKKKKDGKNKEDKDLSTKKLTGGSSSQASTSFIKTSSKDKIIASRCIGLSHIKRQESQWFCSICLEKFTCSIEVHCNRAIHAIETIKQVDPEIAFMIKSSAAKKNLRKPVNALIASKVEEIYEQEKETADYLRFMLLLDRLEKVVKTEADSNVKEPDFETDISVSSIHEESDINEGGSVTQPLHLPNVDVVPEKADDTEEIVSLFEEEDRNVIPSADKTVPNPREDSSMSESPPVETPIVIGLRFLKKKGLKYYCSLCDVTCKGKTLVSCCRHVSSSLHHRHVINLRSSHPVPDFLFFIRKSNAELYHRLVEAEAKKIEADEIRSGGETELKMRKDLLGVDNVPDNNELSRDEQQLDLVQLARAWYEENNATSAIIEDDESAIVKVQSCIENVLVGVSKVVQISELEFNCTLCNIKFDIKLNRKEKNHVNGQLHRKKSLIAAYGKSVEDFLELCAKKNGYVKLNRIVNDACVPLENYEMSNETDETKSIRANLLGVKVNQLPVIMLDNRGETFDIKKAADDFKSSKRIVLSSSTAVCQQEKRSAKASISAPTTISNPSQISALSQISDQCQISAPPQVFDPSQISDQSQISQCESSPHVYDFTNEERSIHTYVDSQTFDVQDNAHIKASTKVDTQACDEPSTCIKNIDKFNKGPEPNTTYATVRAVTFNSTTKQLEDNVARDVAVTFNSTTKQLEDNVAREKKLSNKADTCTDTDVVSKPRIPLFSDFENEGISDGNDKGNLSAAITEETHQRETLVEKETTSRPISRKVSFNSNTKVSFKSKNMKRKSPCNSFKEKNNLQPFKESSPPMPRKLMESKGSWDFKALSKTWSTNSNVQPPLKRIPAKERLGKRNYSQKQPSPNQPTPKQTSPTQPPPKQPPPKQPSPNQPPPKQPPPKQPSPNQPPPKQPPPKQPPPKRLSPKRLSPKSLSKPAHADSKNKRPMGQERHQPRKQCGNPYPMRNQPYVQNSSLDTSNNYKNSEKTADMMAAGPRNLFMESDPKDSIPLPKRNETSQYNGETLSDFNQRNNNNIIPQFSDNRSVNCHTPNTILGINNYPNNYTPTFGLNGNIQANNQEFVSFSQNSSNSSNYKNSGQNDISYMNSGQNDMSYMNSGQNDMSYMNSGQNDMSYMNSGQNDMSYMNSGQNDISYMNSGQNDVSYMNSGKNDISYMNSVEQNGQYSTAFGIDLQAMKNTSLTSALAKVTNIAPITKNFQNHIPKQNDPSLYQPAFNNVSNDKQQW